MKKLLLAILFAIVATSCKKEKIEPKQPKIVKPVDTVVFYPYDPNR